MNAYRVALRHPTDQYVVTVTVFAPNTWSAKDQAAAMHPGMDFVSVVLQES